MTGELQIITESEVVEALLRKLAPVIGDDLPGYRNHIYRVLTYCLHFLQGDETHKKAVEVALVYHDVGLWTDNALAYLEPSEQAALAANAEHGWGLDEGLLRTIIHWHHKISAYRGPNADVVNAVRKADWVDATKGKVRHGLTKEQISGVNEALPALGFYDTLDRLAADLAGGSKMRGLLTVLLKVYKF